MQEPQYVSTAEVAKALSVSVTTVKRWVNNGTLPAQRTVGGHRKILLADVVRLAKEGNWPQAGLERLAGEVPVNEALRVEQRCEQFADALLAGNYEAARALLEESGLRAEQLGDEVIAPAMARLGQAWETGALDVFQEHRATQVCLPAVLALRAKLAPSEPGRPLAIGGGPEKDPYLLANVLVEMTLLENDWNVVNIGPNTPIASFRKALADLRPRLFWLSCSYLADAEEFLESYRPLYEDAERAGVAVAVGGRALVEAVRSRMRYTTFGDGLAHLAAFARELHPRPGGVGAR